jgi:hypothetical protein
MTVKVVNFGKNDRFGPSFFFLVFSKNYLAVCGGKVKYFFFIYFIYKEIQKEHCYYSGQSRTGLTAAVVHSIFTDFNLNTHLQNVNLTIQL